MAATVTQQVVLQISQGAFVADVPLDAENKAERIVLKFNGGRVLAIEYADLDDLIAVIRAIPR